MKPYGILVGLALATLAPISAQSAGVWDNGAAIGDSGYCDMNSAACGSSGWTIYDDFQLSSGTAITGLTYNYFLFDGPASAYVSTDWSIWNSDPRTSFAGGPDQSGNAVGILSDGAAGSLLVTISGLNVTLGSGTYWLGLQNILSDGSSTTYARSGSSHLGNASQSDVNGEFVNAQLADAAFTLSGGSATVTVPEPTTWALMMIGFGGLGATLRRRRAMALAA
jgi:hypothetical protein